MKPRNQLEGLILSHFSCNGRRSFIHFEYCLANIDTAWIHKTAQIFATLNKCVINTEIYWIVGYKDYNTVDRVVFVSNIFHESSCVVSVTIRQFARKILLNNDLRKEKIRRSFGPLNSVQPIAPHSKWCDQSKCITLLSFFIRLTCDFSTGGSGECLKLANQYNI